ncbi:hypothetical protein [Nocardioides daphniae]|uniref:Uncharacterized protein n=1 Tax=Nocardioides daphniae TaxID=402297 RepID=A0A4P7U8D5_9ACTN|nr:hypothetical protein [Nocardioides daphniae]QCC76350.1 hypothetical protein E2C04_02450 [Nocardioides daphniae]GGD07684.1 hypothetical protein GCM10007231_02990 [Nocardioides daphniae]
MLLVLFGIAALVVAGLITLPLAKSAGPGRVAAFAVLALVGVTGVLFLDHEGLLPGAEDADAKDQAALVSEHGEETRDRMVTELEKAAGVKVLQAPSVDALAETSSPTIWRLEQGLTLLCVTSDFPTMAEMACYGPDAMVGEGVTVVGAEGAEHADEDHAEEDHLDESGEVDPETESGAAG